VGLIQPDPILVYQKWKKPKWTKMTHLDYLSSYRYIRFYEKVFKFNESSWRWCSKCWESHLTPYKTFINQFSQTI